MTAKHVQLHIERLVLRGVGGATPAAVAQALQAELQRLLAQPGSVEALAAAGHLERLRVPAIAAAAAPRELGRQAARRIGAGLARLNPGEPRG